jgi:hypothetical protein
LRGEDRSQRAEIGACSGVRLEVGGKGKGQKRWTRDEGRGKKDEIGGIKVTFVQNIPKLWI